MILPGVNGYEAHITDRSSNSAVTPANLSFQWQRELKDKFQEKFEVVRSDVLRGNYGSNPWQEKNQVVTSISWVSRIEDAKESLLRSHWDLIIVDEAHKMSASLIYGVMRSANVSVWKSEWLRMSNQPPWPLSIAARSLVSLAATSCQEL